MWYVQCVEDEALLYRDCVPVKLRTNKACVVKMWKNEPFSVHKRLTHSKRKDVSSLLQTGILNFLPSPQGPSSSKFERPAQDAAHVGSMHTRTLHYWHCFG